MRGAASSLFALLLAAPAAAGPALEALPPAAAAPAVPAPLLPPAHERPGLSQAGYNALIWDGRPGDWYEWWYYKAVLPGTGQAFYFCYGVVNPWDAAQTAPASRSYVSAGSFGGQETAEQAFPVTAFSASASSTFVRVGPNAATDKALKGTLALPGGGEASWDLKVEKDWGFNAMGWTMYPQGVSNIYWFPAQASARMTGTVTWGGSTYRLDKVPAYQDRNWGRSFPKWWTWLVSNSFKGSPGTALAAGGGEPRVIGGINLPNAMGIGLRHNGREYAFRLGSGDYIKLDVNYGKWEVRAANGRGERIEISAYAPEEKFLLLKFMAPQGREFYDYEALLGHIRVKLYQGKKLIADLESDEGGIEFGSGSPQEFQRLFGSKVALH